MYKSAAALALTILSFAPSPRAHAQVHTYARSAALSQAHFPGAAAATGAVITPEQIALHLIDQDAGDTWAEGGDVETLTFNALTCNFKRGACTLTYSFKLYDHPAQTSTCALEAHAPSELVRDTPYGFELPGAITAQIDECMTDSGI